MVRAWGSPAGGRHARAAAGLRPLAAGALLVVALAASACAKAAGTAQRAAATPMRVPTATAAAGRPAPAAPVRATPTATAIDPAHPLRGRVIVLDPGHGDHTGAHSAAGAWEDDDVLAIARRAAAMLSAAGARVRLTRTGPHLLGSVNDTDLTARVADAVAWHADVFISLHQNDSGGSPSVHGVETYYATPRSRLLAQDVQAAMVAGTGLASLGLGHRVFWVVACNPVPAVLVEGGYLSDPAEARLISSPSFAGREAAALTRALTSYFATPGAPAGATSVPTRLQPMCAMGPVQAKTWIQTHWHGRHG